MGISNLDAILLVVEQKTEHIYELSNNDHDEVLPLSFGFWTSFFNKES